MRAREFIFEAAYDSMVDAMYRNYPDQRDFIKQQVQWAKQALKKADRVVWYLRVVGAFLSGEIPQQMLGNYNFQSLEQLQQDLVHFYGFNYVPIENYQYQRQPIGDLINDLTQLENQWKQKQNQEKGVTVKQGDHELFKFSDGTSWWWVDRAYCSDEGRSGNHCGNVVGKHKKDQRILSLRTPNLQVILTFILEPNGTLGEMKAKGNLKPSEKYHPQIMKLLMWDNVTGISGQGYLPEMNFSIFDLSAKDLELIDSVKPKLITDQIAITPVEMLRCQSPNIKQKYANLLPEHLRLLVSNPSLESWEQAIRKDQNLIIYAPHDLPDFEEKLLDSFQVSRSPGELLLKCPNSISRNAPLIGKIVGSVPSALAGVNPNIRGYENICIATVSREGAALIYVPRELKTERVCLAAVTESGVALRYVPRELITEKMCMAAVTQSGVALRYVPRELRTEKMCIAAVAQNGNVLAYVPRELITEKMCIAAVAQNGEALMYVPRELRPIIKTKLGIV